VAVSGSLLGWLVFGVLVLVMLALDLGVAQRSQRVIPLREALRWTALWFTAAVLFGIGIHLRMGGQKALEFYTGYLVELSLSADNVFVFLMLFTYFRVPPQNQNRVLFWGIVGALLLRGVFIVAGVALINRLHAIIYVFGALLVGSGIRMALDKGAEIHPERNPLLRLARRFLPFTKDFVEGRFFTVRDGRRMATPLLLVLLMVGPTDLVFAIDSIPAVLAITRDPFLVLTSNVFAVLGLRAMFFALAGVIELFHYLSLGLSLVLILIGAKMLLSDVVSVPTWASLAGIAVILGLAVLASLVKPEDAKKT
jgi:tellurite resistance protein TerC